jgi:hypothetical protein
MYGVQLESRKACTFELLLVLSWGFAWLAVGACLGCCLQGKGILGKLCNLMMWSRVLVIRLVLAALRF